MKETREKIGWEPFGVRWIDCGGGDSKRLELRSRMAVHETRRTSTIGIRQMVAVTANTLLLEVLCSLVSVGDETGEPLVMQFLDVSRPMCVNSSVDAPREMRLERGMCDTFLVWDARRRADIRVCRAGPLLANISLCKALRASVTRSGNCCTSCMEMATRELVSNAMLIGSLNGTKRFIIDVRAVLGQEEFRDIANQEPSVYIPSEM